MASLAPAVVGWLATYLLHSTLLIGGVWLLTRSPRPTPATRDLLWKTALLGGLATSTASMMANAPGRLHLVMDRVTHRPEAGMLSGPPQQLAWSGASVERTVQVRARVLEVGRECRARLGDEAVEPDEVRARVREVCGTLTGASAGWRWYDTLAVLWLIGALTGLSLLVRDHRGFRAIRSRLRPASARTALCLAEVLERPAGDRGAGPGRGGDAGSCARDPGGARLRGLRLRISDELAGPCVLPGAVVGLPAMCEEELTDSELRAVLAHEIAHVARRDVVWSTVLRALSAVLWIQPLNRVALAGCTEAAELACDDWALARTGERYGLASSISRVARWSLGSAAAVGVPMIGRTGEGGLVRRVRRILAEGPQGPERRWLRTALAAMLVVPLNWLPAVPVIEAPTRAVFLATSQRIEADSTDGREVTREELREVRGVLIRTVASGTLLDGEAERRLILRVGPRR
jgi:hypothetical protein